MFGRGREKNGVVAGDVVDVNWFEKILRAMAGGGVFIWMQTETASFVEEVDYCCAGGDDF